MEQNRQLGACWGGGPPGLELAEQIAFNIEAFFQNLIHQMEWVMQVLVQWVCLLQKARCCCICRCHAGYYGGLQEPVSTKYVGGVWMKILAGEDESGEAAGTRTLGDG